MIYDVILDSSLICTEKDALLIVSVTSLAKACHASYCCRLSRKLAFNVASKFRFNSDALLATLNPQSSRLEKEKRLLNCHELQLKILGL